MAVEKRIPNGTRVTWRSRYESDPLHEGTVKSFHPKGTGFLSAWYSVEVPANRPTRRILTPLADNLEAQNPDKLKRVK